MRALGETVDEYIAAFPVETQQRLGEIRTLVREAAPDAIEKISYAIPTFDLNGHHLVHFAGYKKHIGFYPGSQTVPKIFAEELEPYKRGKGSVQFPLDRPLPLGLIRRMVEVRVEESNAEAAR